MELSIEDDSSDSYGDEYEEIVQEFIKAPDPVGVSPAEIYIPEPSENEKVLRDALAENVPYEGQLSHFLETLYRANAEIKKRLKEVAIDIMRDTNTGNDAFSYLKCGRPYFKDKNNVPPPDNEDTITMRQLQMYDFSEVSSVPGWTVKDKTELVNALQELSRDTKRKELTSRIAQLRRESDTDNIVEIANLEKKISELQKTSLMELALPLDMEYDWEALANSLNRRHTAQEYQALWKLFFHPSINKSTWGTPEHQELQKIATAYGSQNWDAIAKQLNTGRTGYQCFVYHRTNMVDFSSNRKWTSEEIEYLQRVIDYFKEGTYIPWGKVATAMDNRTKIQVYNKYTRMMERRKGRFLEEEDVVIVNCYEVYGYDFKKMALFLPGRSPVQIRTRFHLLTKFRLSQTWTVEDDRKLIQIMANLDSSASFATATTYFPGKDRMHIRSRYTTLMRWMKAHPATDIAMAPRRGARRLLHGYAHINLLESLKNLAKRMESEAQDKKSKGITICSSEASIEDGIMAILMNEIIKEEANKKAESGDIHSPSFHHDAMLHDTTNLSKMLVFLNAALNKSKFDNSKYAKKFHGLTERTPEKCLLKVKSYSKKQSIKTIRMDTIPDVWGNIKLGTTSYVLPANYATLTGCRVIMKHVSGLEEDEINLSFMARKNFVLQEALCTLKERFASVFLWPILLSNEGPGVMNTNITYVPKTVLRQNHLPQSPNVTIPPQKKVHLIFQEKQTRKFEGAKDKSDDAKRRKIKHSVGRTGKNENVNIDEEHSNDTESGHVRLFIH